MKIGIVVAILIVVAPSLGWGKSVSKDLDALGVNRDLVRKAKKMRPKQSIKIVQKRAVDRNWRVEGTLGYGIVAGGNPYLDSSILDTQLDLHITPRWSIGGRYFRFDNDLSSEGERVFNPGNNGGIAPDVQDFPTQAYMGTVSWYPIYGKVNLFNWDVTQFDIFLTAGYGTIQLKESGNTGIMTVGGGAGFWLTNWLTTRFEVRYQNYSDKIDGNQTRSIDQTIFSAKMGFLL